MDNTARIRFLAASIISPLLVPLIIYAMFSFIFGGDIDKDKEIETSISTAVRLSYGLALVFGIASYYWLRRQGSHSVFLYLILGGVAGFARWLLFSLISQTFLSILFYIFGIAGIVMGGSFWLIAYFQPSGNYPRSTSSRRRRRR